MVLGAAALVRLAACVALPETRFPDSNTYEDLAASVRERGELVDRLGKRAAVTPGYPLFIAGCRAVLGESRFAYRVPQLVLGVLTVLGLYLLGRAVWGERAGLAAGALGALDPFAVYFESLELTEGPAVFLLVWAALAGWVARRRAWAAPLAGLAAGCCALVRPGWGTIAAALFAGAMLVGGEGRPREREAWARAGLAALVAALVLTPWALRNRAVLGETVIFSTMGGQALFEGCSENATGAPDVPGTVGVRVRGIESLSETEISAELSRDARHWIRSNPGKFARLALVKFGRTWSPVPNEAAHRRWYHMLASALNWAAILSLAGCGVWLLRARRGAVLWCLLPAAAVLAAHLFYVGSVRYRMPAWPFLELLAAGGLIALLGRLKPEA